MLAVRLPQAMRQIEDLLADLVERDQVSRSGWRSAR